MRRKIDRRLSVFFRLRDKRFVVVKIYGVNSHAGKWFWQDKLVPSRIDSPERRRCNPQQEYARAATFGDRQETWLANVPRAAGAVGRYENVRGMLEGFDH